MASLWLQVLVGWGERVLCVPGFGDAKTGMVSILDTPDFSVFLWRRRYKEGEKILGGDTYEKCWKQVWEDGPHVLLWTPVSVYQRPVFTAQRPLVVGISGSVVLPLCARCGHNVMPKCGLKPQLSYYSFRLEAESNLDCG